MTDRLVDFLGDREKRTLRMRDALREVGFDLDEAEISSGSRKANRLAARTWPGQC